MFSLAISSLTQPGPAITQVLRQNFDNATLFLVAALLACITGIMDPVIGLLLARDTAIAAPLPPFVVAGIQMGAIMVTALAAHRIGAMFGGKGNFNGSLKVSVWYGVVSILPSLAILILQATGSGAAPLVQLVVLVWMMFVLSTFIKVLHGFDNLFLTALGVVGASFIIGIVSVLILSAFGLIQPENL